MEKATAQSLELVSLFLFISSNELLQYYNFVNFSGMMVHDENSVGCCVSAGGPLWLGAEQCGGVGVLSWVWSCMGLSSCALVVCCLWSHAVPKSN